MASPEVVEPAGTLDSRFPEEFSAPEGWKKKLVLRKAGTPKKKDVVYFAPSGDEIRSKRQLEKYLKKHPGGPPVSDFDWTTGETPRRSARLSTKGRLSSDSTEAEPAPKRNKVDSNDETVTVRPPRKTSKRKSEPQTDAAGKDDVMEDAEKADGDNTSADCVEAGSGEKLEEEKEVPTENEPVENNTVEMHEEAEVTPEEKVPDAEGVTSTGNSADKANAEEQVSETEESVIVTDTVMEEANVLDEGSVILEQSVAASVEVSTVEEVVKPSEGETSLNEIEAAKVVEVEDILDVATTEDLDVKDGDGKDGDGRDGDPLELNEHIESRGIHALIEESVLSGISKSPGQQTEPPLSSAEPVGVSI